MLLFTGGTALGHLGFHGEAIVRLYAERTELILKVPPQDAWMLMTNPPSYDEAGIATAIAFFSERAPKFYEITGAGARLPVRSATVTHEVDGRFAFVLQYPRVSWPLRIRVAFSKEFGGDFQVPVSVFDLRENRFRSDPVPIAAALQTEQNNTLEFSDPKVAPVASGMTSPTPGEMPTAKTSMRASSHRLPGSPLTQTLLSP